MSEAEAPKFEITFERTLAHHDQWQMGVVTGAAATLFLDFLLSAIAVAVGILGGAWVCLEAGWPLNNYFISVGALVGTALFIQFGVPFAIGTFQLPIDLYVVKKGGSFLGPCTVRAFDETISETKRNAQRIYNWSAILKLSHSQSAVFLFTDRAEAIFIPVDAFMSEDEFEGFCTFCEQKIQKANARRARPL